MAAAARAGEEFREDLRAPGARNAQARRLLSPAELEPLTRLSVPLTLLAIAQTLAVIGAGIALGLADWPGAWIVPAVLVIGIGQHGLFILSHEAAHYRLFANRALNDFVGRLVGMSGGVSMCTYRVVHRLHHNDLYGTEDPDTAIHGGYPRGRRYLLAKLLRDLLGLNAWKNYAYFFGAPALNDETRRTIRPLDDTSPQLRGAARRDRWWVAAFHLAAPLAAWALGGATGLLQYLVLWLVPLLTVLQPILRLRAVLEHGGVQDLSSPLTAARTNRTWGSAPNLLARTVLFPHHVNYHLEHHLYPAVPHYRLPRLHALLQAKGALQQAEVRDVQATWNIVYAERRGP